VRKQSTEEASVKGIVVGTKKEINEESSSEILR